MKYKNKKVEINGIVFDSIMESDYYKYLQEQVCDGLIKEVRLQPTFLLIPAFQKNKQKIRKITYKADFHVFYADGTEFVIDVKGVETKDFKLKKKLFDYTYPDLELKVLTYYKSQWIELKDKPKKKPGKGTRHKGRIG